MIRLPIKYIALHNAQKTLTFLFIGIIFFIFSPQPISAADTTTNCWVTNYGTPDENDTLPAGCATLARVPLYKQWDSRWGRIPYGNCGDGSTLASSACGSTSLAMVISYHLGREVLPPETSQKAVANGWRPCGNGTAWAAMTGMPPLYGLRGKAISWNEAKTYLSLGIPIIQSHGRGLFTSEGHFVVVTGKLSNGKYAINDPDGRHITEASEGQITASNKAQWVIYR
ncbi:MAG TPA: C39 family peptidase [Patescibacteria group bacterium]|nr:C39 family peptidase [Patescibacteria group bacterium]